MAFDARSQGEPTIDRAGKADVARFQIRSQALRQANAFAPPGPMLGFGQLPDSTGTESSMGEGGRKAWRASDVTRAIRAAEKAGLSTYRVEIAPDGTISIVAGPTAETASDSPPCHEAPPTNR